MYINLRIKVPKLIANIVLWFVLRYRIKHYGFAFRRIRLTKGKFAIVDPDDYQKLSQYNWQLFESTYKNYYAVRLEGRTIVSMHREILNAPVGSIVDHIYGDGLDNRKANLRIATEAQNHYNRRKTTKKTSSKYKGVYLKKESNKYGAAIRCNGKRTHLGYFDSEIDAAKAYDNAARLYHGDFASLNFS